MAVRFNTELPISLLTVDTKVSRELDTTTRMLHMKQVVGYICPALDFKVELLKPVRRGLEDRKLNEDPLLPVGLDILPAKAKKLASFLSDRLINSPDDFTGSDLVYHVQGWNPNDKIGAIAGPVNIGRLVTGQPYILAEHSLPASIDTQLSGQPAPGTAVTATYSIDNFFPPLTDIMGGPACDEAISVIHSGDRPHVIVSTAANLLLLNPQATDICPSGPIK